MKPTRAIPIRIPKKVSPTCPSLKPWPSAKMTVRARETVSQCAKEGRRSERRRTRVGKEETVEKTVDQAKVTREEHHDGLGAQEDEGTEEGLVDDLSGRTTATLLLSHNRTIAGLLAKLLSATSEKDGGVARVQKLVSMCR